MLFILVIAFPIKMLFSCLALLLVVPVLLHAGLGHGDARPPGRGRGRRRAQAEAHRGLRVRPVGGGHHGRSEDKAVYILL